MLSVGSCERGKDPRSLGGSSSCIDLLQASLYTTLHGNELNYCCPVASLHQTSSASAVRNEAQNRNSHSNGSVCPLEAGNCK